MRSGPGNVSIRKGTVNVADRPVLAGREHLYPEAAAAAALPWLARFARPEGSEPHRLRSAGIGLVAGAFVWLHVKLLLVGTAAAALVAWRLRRRTAPLALLAAAFAAPTLAFLPYQYRLTGLFRPDGLYLRYGSGVWTGVSGVAPARLAAGLANALAGGRDGILIMAPTVVAALLAAPRFVSRDRRGGGEPDRSRLPAARPIRTDAPARLRV